MEVFLTRAQIRSLVRSHLGQTTDETLAGSTTAQFNGFIDSAALKVAADARWASSASRATVLLPFGSQTAAWPADAQPGSLVEAACFDPWDVAYGPLERVRIPARADTDLAQILIGEEWDRALGDPVYVEPRGDAIYVWPPSDGQTVLEGTDSLSGTAWSLTGATAAIDADRAPDGTATAWKLAEDGSTGGHSIAQSVTPDGRAQAYSLAVWARADERTRLVLTLGASTGSSTATFNLSTGAVAIAGASTGTHSGATATISAGAGGWFLCVLTAQVGHDAALTGTMALDNGSGSSYAGTIGSGVLLWTPILTLARRIRLAYNRRITFADDSTTSIVDAQMIVLWALVLACGAEGDRDQADRYTLQYQDRLRQLRGWESTGVRIRVSGEASFDENDDNGTEVPNWDTRPTVRG